MIGLGCCAPLRDFEELKAIGFDYVECSAEQIVAINDEPAKYVNRFLPSGLSIFSKTDQQNLRKHTATVISTAKQKGVQIITFGSGGARMLASDTISSEEERYWREFLFFLDEIASRNGVTIALEPLVKRETNFMNTIGEAAQWISMLGLRSFGITIDSYHLQEEKDPRDAIERERSLIVHAHISSSNQSVPSVLTTGLKEYLQQVKSLECDLSLEMVPYDFKTIPEDFVQKIMEEVK